MRIPGLAAFGVATLLLAFARAGAQEFDEKGMKEALKKGAKVPEVKGAPAAKGAPSELNPDNYNKVVAKSGAAFLAFYSKTQEEIWAPAKKALTAFADNHGDKVKTGYMEISAARKSGVAKQLGLPETPPLPYFVLVKDRAVKHRFDNAEHTSIKDEGKPRKLTQKAYFEAAVHHCLTPLALKPEPKKVPCSP